MEDAMSIITMNRQTRREPKMTGQNQPNCAMCGYEFQSEYDHHNPEPLTYNFMARYRLNFGDGSVRNMERHPETDTFRVCDTCNSNVVVKFRIAKAINGWGINEDGYVTDRDGEVIR
jgi:hypothetical protein